MKRKDKIKLCTGCESLYKTIEFVSGELPVLNCTMDPIYEDRECPCLICLVKMRCIISDSECEEFMEYRRNIPVRLL